MLIVNSTACSCIDDDHTKIISVELLVIFFVGPTLVIGKGQNIGD